MGLGNRYHGVLIFYIIKFISMSDFFRASDNKLICPACLEEDDEDEEPYKLTEETVYTFLICKISILYTNIKLRIICLSNFVFTSTFVL